MKFEESGSCLGSCLGSRLDPRLDPCPTLSNMCSILRKPTSPVKRFIGNFPAGRVVAP